MNNAGLEIDGSGPAPGPAWIEVDLGALRHNLTLVRRRVAPAKVLAVAKADAYGHGAVRVGQCLAAAGVDWLGVALVREGVALRVARVETPILVLGPSRQDELALFRRHDLTPMVSSLEQLARWVEWAAGDLEPLGIHLKVDTGMHRLGLSPEELAAALEAVRSAPGLCLTGLASHLAEADDPGSPRNAEQAARFQSLLGRLTDEESERTTVHFANSAAALHTRSTRHQMVRCGLALYGLDPVGSEKGLRPVMSVRARISLIRSVEAGERVGYGGAWRAPAATRLAVVPVGYGDGYPWRAWPEGRVLVGGRRRALAGRVSMDMTTVEVGEGAAVGDEVVFLGRQGEGEITAQQLAQWAGTIAWETLCLFALRLPRRYVDEA